MNITLKYILILFTILLAGCAGNDPKPALKESIQIDKEDPKLDFNSKVIGFAHMKDGDELVSVSKTNDTPMDDDVEVIKIREDGFSPAYYVSHEQENGKLILCSLADWKNKQNNQDKICDSHYTSHTALDIMLNAGVWLLGDPSNMKIFDKKYFLEVVEKNNLMAEQKKLLNEN